MSKILFTINAILTLPFGIIALFFPEAVFEGFGIVLNDGGQLIARGYAATLIGFGLLFFLFRNESKSEFIKPLLLSALIFNSIEAIIQGIAGINSVALPVIWGTVVAHSIMAILCYAGMMKTKA